MEEGVDAGARAAQLEAVADDVGGDQADDAAREGVEAPGFEGVGELAAELVPGLVALGAGGELDQAVVGPAGFDGEDLGEPGAEAVEERGHGFGWRKTKPQGSKGASLGF